MEYLGGPAMNRRLDMDIVHLPIQINVGKSMFSSLVSKRSDSHILVANTSDVEKKIKLYVGFSGIVSFRIKQKVRDLTQVLWQKPLHSQKNPKSNVTSQKRHKKLRLHNDFAPT